MVPKLNPPSVELVDAEAAGGLLSIARDTAVLDAGQWLLALYEADLTPQVLLEIAPLSVADVRRIALALPGVTEGTSYGTTAFRVGQKFLARLHQNGNHGRPDRPRRSSLRAA